LFAALLLHLPVGKSSYLEKMKKRVLIIEDDQDIADILGFVTRQLNLDVITSDRAMFIPDIKRLSPDLIVSDHWLGTELGGNMCKNLKSKASTREIPVILISAAANLPAIASESRADAYIFKPFDVNELVDLVTALLYKKKAIVN
jgi:two-component system, OmpR family, phosphate regulon response regulator PhoB